MKFLVTLLAVLSLSQHGHAFSIQRGTAAVRPAGTSLKMTVEEKATKTVRVGVIGCGRIGLVHLEAITKAPGVVPVIVSNPTVSKAEAGVFIFDTLILLYFVSPHCHVFNSGFYMIFLF